MSKIMKNVTILGFVLIITSMISLTQSAKTQSQINLTGGELGSLGGYSQSQGVGLISSSRPPSQLARVDWEAIYAEANMLIEEAIQFRLANLQQLPQEACTSDPNETVACANLLLNYADYNNGDLMRAFCEGDLPIDEQGNCTNEDAIRNKLVRARDLFIMMLLEPSGLKTDDLSTNQVGDEKLIRELGEIGMLQATREIVYVHLIFGSEFLVDGLDYRFSSQATASANGVIQEELGQLEEAKQQFQLGVDVLLYAFNADVGWPREIYISEYFTETEFELFNRVSERMISTIDEMASRYRAMDGASVEIDGELVVIDGDVWALELYQEGMREQYVQAATLAQQAAMLDKDFLNNGGWELLTNISRLRVRAQAIEDGLNPFGFMDDYVPLQSYVELDGKTRAIFLNTAQQSELKAASAQREFDQNATALRAELQNLRLAYQNRLLELCGASSDNYQTCDGGLMEKNFFDWVDRALAIEQAATRLQNNSEKIQIEAERASQVIQITVSNGQQLSLLSYQAGVISSYRVTESVIDSTAEHWHTGLENVNTISVSGSYGWPGCIFGCASASASISVSNINGFKYSNTKTASVNKVWDPSALAIGEINSLRDLQQAATSAQITGANSAATIKNLLLEQAVLLINLDRAINQYNEVAATHNHLVEQYTFWLDLREDAQANLEDSYLNNPAFKIIRETETVQSVQDFAIAQQFAYLAGKALEYDRLTPIPFQGDIYRARTTHDILVYLDNLAAWEIGTRPPQERFPYEISLAEDILGLTDENLNPDGLLSSFEVQTRRFAEVQAFIQAHLDEEAQEVRFNFTTALQNNQIFSQSIWNNRIAGVGFPLTTSEGVKLVVQTRQFGDIGQPEIILVHGGQAFYRTSSGAYIEYKPRNAAISGYLTPDQFNPIELTAVIRAGIGDDTNAIATSAFNNRSVAASNWTMVLKLDEAANQQLDITQIEDIQIRMDTTGFALQGLREAAEADSERLTREFEDNTER